MRITAVETFPLIYPMPYALTYARGEYQAREALLVKVHTSYS
jgi:D-arabinonate dehydratase/D-galactarolactone cycloisomerase